MQQDGGLTNFFVNDDLSMTTKILSTSYQSGHQTINKNIAAISTTTTIASPITATTTTITPKNTTTITSSMTTTLTHQSQHITTTSSHHAFQLHEQSNQKAQQQQPSPQAWQQQLYHHPCQQLYPTTITSKRTTKIYKNLIKHDNNPRHKNQNNNHGSPMTITNQNTNRDEFVCLFVVLSGSFFGRFDLFRWWCASPVLDSVTTSLPWLRVMVVRSFKY